MSLSAGQKLLHLASGLAKTYSKLSGSVRGIQSLGSAQTHRSFTRSMWSLCSGQNTGQAATQAGRLNGNSRWNKTCGCCGIHTTGDKELAEFLSQEIDYEKKSADESHKIPQISGFNVELTGSEILLTKEKDGEKITVEMNINHSVQDIGGGEYEDVPQAQANEAAEMVAQPQFTVKINKGGELTLAIQCDFPDNDGLQPPAEGQEAYDDVVEITEVAMLRGEWDEKVYAVSGSVMDGNLYDMLMNLLEERGLTGKMVEQVVELATHHDQQKYIQFLQDLRTFTTS